jgi:NADH:ubiquinone oxidoreductase subunit F (NADH-binding)
MTLLPEEPVASLADWIAVGGGEGLARARAMAPGALIQEVQLSRLRGRGGAGFPTGTKWASVAAGGPATRYAVCNAAEGEPGTFKDRALIRANPYQLLEGLLIAGHAVDATASYVAVKASFEREHGHLARALAELVDAGWVDRPVQIVTGPEEYLFGEEKALLEVIEGNEPLPRWLPPYLHGLFATAPQLGWEPRGSGPVTVLSDADADASANPTLVNNVETLANVPHILARGPEWFRSRGTEQSPGTVCCTVVGDVTRPAVVEVELGTPLREVLDRCGGPASGRTVRAVFSGVSNAVIVAEQLDTPVSYEALDAIGSGLGSAGFIVYDDSTCLVEVAAMLSRFLSVESCGQCPPCKLGTGAITRALERIRDGTGGDRELDVLAERLRVVSDGNRCYLPVEEQHIVASVLRAFPEDVANHIEQGRCPRPRELPFPKLVDLADGVATYDERQLRKRPDWTYDEPSASEGLERGSPA